MKIYLVELSPEDPTHGWPKEGESILFAIMRTCVQHDMSRQETLDFTGHFCRNFRAFVEDDVIREGVCNGVKEFSVKEACEIVLTAVMEQDKQDREEEKRRDGRE